jgi:hypothetical protein
VTGLRGARAAADAILSGRNYLKDLKSLQRACVCIYSSGRF